ncbi:uncharacterized protein LOC107867203 isoform X2 [Capsicum annuum]|uniref:uncharacterized protein LOC107867203 isoform X2 n=1 Tax=Capsicum annuum TaxID=4072 RepID=UPI001FB0F7B1|nr:uncharacterized protein LOC107867203 isoform X2 [Capsicum annuum]
MGETRETSIEAEPIVTIDHHHPLYLQASDTPGAVIIPIKLTGPENYDLWSRSMKLALRDKGKLGFIDGSCAKHRFKGELAELWEKCNAIVLSWIGCTVAAELMPTILYASNAKQVWIDFKKRFDRSNLTQIYHLWTEIVTLRQGMDSVTTYYSKMKDACHELDIMAPLPHCDCEESRAYLEHLRSQRLLQFLMVLNESFNQIRSNILARAPVITVNEAYAIVAQEESQRSLGVIDDKKEIMALFAGKSQSNKFDSVKEATKRFDMFCEYCGYKNHVKEDCYKLVGYPNDF